MCSQYWNLTAPVKCLKCGEEHDWELQTHFQGEMGSCVNFYDVGEQVPELHGIQAAVLDGGNDDFIGACPACHAWADVGAEIKNGAVVRVWALMLHKIGASA